MDVHHLAKSVVAVLVCGTAMKQGLYLVTIEPVLAD
jgi:hypothetical protein